MKRDILRSLVLIFFPLTTLGQTGGLYQIEKSSISSGGGSSSGGNYSVEVTAGQTLAGDTSQGGQYSISSGFWTPALAPTAATVLVAGRVTTADGRGIRNARVSLIDSAGTTRVFHSAAFGHFRFAGITAGQTVIVTIQAKRFIFSQPTVVLNVTDDVLDLNFTAEN